MVLFAISIHKLFASRCTKHMKTDMIKRKGCLSNNIIVCSLKFSLWRKEVFMSSKSIFNVVRELQVFVYYS